MKYYLTIDAGTSVIKSVLFNTNFKEVFSYSIKNPVIIDENGNSEVDMNHFWLLTTKCIKTLINKSKVKSQSVIGIGITGNMVGFWSIDENNKSVRKAILWNDTRSQKIFKNNKIFYITFSFIEYKKLKNEYKQALTSDENKWNKNPYILRTHNCYAYFYLKFLRFDPLHTL